MKKNNNHITIEDLAAMVKRGFDQTATKEDVYKLTHRLDRVEEIQKDMLEELNVTHTDIRHIRSTTDALVHSDIAQEDAIEDLTSRVHRVEKKVGFTQ